MYPIWHHPSVGARTLSPIYNITCNIYQSQRQKKKNWSKIVVASSLYMSEGAFYLVANSRSAHTHSTGHRVCLSLFFLFSFNSLRVYNSSLSVRYQTLLTPVSTIYIKKKACSFPLVHYKYLCVSPRRHFPSLLQMIYSASVLSALERPDLYCRCRCLNFFDILFFFFIQQKFFDAPDFSKQLKLQITDRKIVKHVYT
jgi:hypothetical protein